MVRDTMGATKFPILDDNFYPRMIAACTNDEQRGLITILDLTGMHVSSVCKLGPESMIRQGDRTYLKWTRPKNKKTLQDAVPDRKVQIIEKFLKMRRKSGSSISFMSTELVLTPGTRTSAQ